MTELSRRQFLKQTGADAAALGILASMTDVALHAAPFDWPIGSQTYPHRTLLNDFPALCKTMADMGVTRLELCSPIGYREFASLADGKAVKRILSDHGLECESCHFSMRELREKQQDSLAWAKDVGITQVITASLGDGNGGSNPTMDQVKKAADEYNKIGAVTAAAGLQQGLHNEGFELAMVDGQRVYDMLFALLDPKLVKFQFQMSTITSGLVGADYFTKYPGRFFSMHLQDIDMNAPTPAGTRRPQVAVGMGSIDWVKTFRAAKIGGVRNYFVEQSLALTKESVAFLKTLKVT
jgi:sugar phosphate isomerase/epimerase